MSAPVDPRISRLVQRMHALGHRATSVVRTPEKNREVGGSPTSKHLTGEAADFPISLASLADVLSLIDPGDGLQVLLEVDHIHVECDAKEGVIVEIPKHMRNERGDRWLRIRGT